MPVLLTTNGKRLNIALSSGATKATVTLDADERDSTFEYAVAYKNSKASLSLPKYLVSSTRALSKIDEHYDIGSNPQEKQNKGYLLSVNFNAGYGGNGTSSDSSYYYAEKVEWDEWNYNERSVGPTSAYISIKNYNISSDWTKLVTLDSDLHNSSKETVTNTTIKNDAETEFYLKPTKLSDSSSVTDGSMINTTGPLMVLRDAKHYYSLTLERSGLSEPAVIGNDDSVYGYRQISDAELIRTTMLSLEKAIVDTGMENSTTGTVTNLFNVTIEYISGYNGSFGWSQDAYSKLNWYITDYVPTFASTPGQNKTLPGYLMISDPNTDGKRRGRKQAKTIKFFCFDETSTYSSSKLISMNISPTDYYGINLESYSAELQFAVSSSNFTANVLHNGNKTSSVSATNSDAVKRWCPINVDGNGNNENNSTYGWWN